MKRQRQGKESNGLQIQLKITGKNGRKTVKLLSWLLEECPKFIVMTVGNTVYMEISSDV